jgi:hypothetical protein
MTAIKVLATKDFKRNSGLGGLARGYLDVAPSGGSGKEITFRQQVTKCSRADFSRRSLGGGGSPRFITLVPP